MLEKNSVHIITIEDIGSKGEGIGRINGFVVFADNCLPGDVCEIIITKSKKSYAYGKVLNIITQSDRRVESPCEASLKCGGCSLMHMDYKSQLEFKEKKVKDSLARIGGIKDTLILPIEPMENTKGYRNKAQIPIRCENDKLKIGYYAKNSHRVIESKDCYIQQSDVKSIVNIIRLWMEENNISPYNELDQRGIVRHIFIRQAFFTDDLLVSIVLNKNKNYLPKNHEMLIRKLRSINNITGILLNYNNENTNVVMGTSNKLLWGKDYIIDYLGDLEFKISAHSFFQINPVQALKMYNCALSFSGVTENDIVIDAYCGIGTISLFFAKKAKKVYGIEIVPAAIADAKYNAAKNAITNTEFLLGESERLILDLIKDNVKVQILIVDPPRKGCEKSFLEAINTLKPQKIIYISCNPDTLARDIAILANFGYFPEKIKPFDMFSHTTHVECVCLLEYKPIEA